MTSETLIINYLTLHLPRELPGLDIWRSAVVKARTPRGYVQAGEIGQADITGVWGGRCECGHLRQKDLQWYAGHPEYENGGGCTGCGCGFRPCGRSIWIEVKAPGDRQKPAQKDFERRVSRLGALYVICAVKDRRTVAWFRRYFELPLIDRPGTHPVELSDFFGQLRERL